MFHGTNINTVIDSLADMCVSGSLQIQQSLESDEGKYECVAENRVGVAYSYGANLYVRGASDSGRLLILKIFGISCQTVLSLLKSRSITVGSS